MNYFFQFFNSFKLEIVIKIDVENLITDTTKISYTQYFKIVCAEESNVTN